MDENDQKALDNAYAAQIKAIFDGIYTDLAVGVDPGSQAFTDLLRRAGRGIKQAKYVKGILAALLEGEYGDSKDTLA